MSISLSISIFENRHRRTKFVDFNLDFIHRQTAPLRTLVHALGRSRICKKSMQTICAIQAYRRTFMYSSIRDTPRRHIVKLKQNMNSVIVTNFSTIFPIPAPLDDADTLLNAPTTWRILFLEHQNAAKNV
jgi:hypothetical protein